MKYKISRSEHGFPSLWGFFILMMAIFNDYRRSIIRVSKVVKDPVPPRTQSFQLLVPYGLGRTQLFQLRVSLGTHEDAVISASGTMGTRKDSVISTSGSLQAGSD